jgi:endonuclease YncB( thermonuclease family)
MSEYTYRAWLLAAHDGDTVKCCTHLEFKTRAKPAYRDFGFHTYLEDGRLVRHDSFRLAGLNAPELATPAGKVARAYLLDWLDRWGIPVSHTSFDGVKTDAYEVTITTVKDSQEKYGRFLATVYGRSGESLNLDLISSGHAAPWNGSGAAPVPTA